MLGNAKERSQTVRRGSKYQDTDPTDDHVYGDCADRIYTGGFEYDFRNVGVQ